MPRKLFMLSSSQTFSSLLFVFTFTCLAIISIQSGCSSVHSPHDSTYSRSGCTSGIRSDCRAVITSREVILASYSCAQWHTMELMSCLVISRHRPPPSPPSRGRVGLALSPPLADPPFPFVPPLAGFPTSSIPPLAGSPTTLVSWGASEGEVRRGLNYSSPQRLSPRRTYARCCARFGS